MNRDLVGEAQAVRERAYAPYSSFRVGAAVEAGSGIVYAGCNVENASYGLSMCAERVALFNALASGEREIRAVAVASVSGALPCGACRQVLAEFAPCPEDVPVIAINEQGDELHYTLGQLLPYGFSREDLELP